MSKLTRQGARNLTATLDRIASVVADNHDLLGIDSRIASDFAFKCDLLSDAIETTAASNFPLRQASSQKGVDEEGMSVEHGDDGFDPNLIGDRVSGPLEAITPPSHEWAKDHFTQEKYHVLGELKQKHIMGPKVTITAALRSLEAQIAQLKKLAGEEKIDSSSEEEEEKAEESKKKASRKRNFHGFDLTK